jgi:hypothetical protein
MPKHRVTKVNAGRYDIDRFQIVNHRGSWSIMEGREPGFRNVPLIDVRPTMKLAVQAVREILEFEEKARTDGNSA